MSNDEILRRVREVSHSQSKWRRINCPFCADGVRGEDTKRAMGVNTRTGGYHCFKCSAHGYVDLGMDRIDADDEPPTKPDIVALPEMPKPEGFWPIFDGPGRTSEVFARARASILSRGILEDDARAAGVGACLRGYFEGRVVIPVVDEACVWRYYVTRTFTGHEKKYLYPKGQRGGLLYNAVALKRVTDEPALIVEGTLDAIYCGMDRGVAVFGKTTAAHAEELAVARRPVVLCPDGDAWRESLAYAEHYLGGIGTGRVGLLRLSVGLDPDEIPRPLLYECARRSLTSETPVCIFGRKVLAPWQCEGHDDEDFWTA